MAGTRFLRNGEKLARFGSVLRLRKLYADADLQSTGKVIQTGPEVHPWSAAARIRRGRRLPGTRSKLL